MKQKEDHKVCDIYYFGFVCHQKTVTFSTEKVRGVVAGREAETCGRKRRVYMTKCVWDDFTASMHLSANMEG